MDNIKLETNLPQEEDYAIANVTPYSMVHCTAFPLNFFKYFRRYGLFNGINEREMREWKRRYLYELKKATFMSGGKRLVLKSPINTGKVKELLEMFPNAKFIHIMRNPYNVCLSTSILYKKLFPIFDLQYAATDEELDESQLTVYEEIYKKYIAEKELIPKENLVEFKYEMFIENPLETLKEIYKTLGLPGYDKASIRFAEYIESEKTYKTNKYEASKEKLDAIRQRAGFAFKEFGYSDIPDEELVDIESLKNHYIFN